MKKLSDMPEVDKPLERLVKLGLSALSSRELLMVLWGSCVLGRDIAVLARDILKVIEAKKGALRLEGLSVISGIGVAKAAKILGIQAVDHLIITKSGHFCFQSEGLLK